MSRTTARFLLWLGHIHRRMLGFWFTLLGSKAAYAVTAALGRLLYRLLLPVRAISEGQCRAALKGHADEAEIPRIAERAFVNRVLNLTDIILSQRLLHRGAFPRYGGRIPQPYLDMLLGVQGRRPVILVTGYYGPYDLLPVFLGYNGIRAAAVYKPHANKYFDSYRDMIRRRSGGELIPADGAADRVASVLAANGTVAILADHHAERGMDVRFLDLPTRIKPVVGLLAWRYQAYVAVAGIRRVGGQFRFEIIVTDLIDPREWSGRPDPGAYITDRCLRAQERIILADPTQYLWAYPRWGQGFAAGFLSAGG